MDKKCCCQGFDAVTHDVFTFSSQTRPLSMRFLFDTHEVKLQCKRFNIDWIGKRICIVFVFEIHMGNKVSKPLLLWI
jgi:hypothetical protein